MDRSTRPLPLWSALLCGGALLVASPAFSQVQIEDARTAPVETATAGDGGVPSDVTVGTSGTITLETDGPALTLNSDNDLNHQGQVTINNVDGATGVLLEGGADRNYAQTGTISIVEDFSEANTDDDPLADTPFASGTGRTGILVSGASPFQGNISLLEASDIIIEGNNSYGINLDNTPIGAGLDGDLTLDGRIRLTGDDGAAVRIGSAVTGNVAHGGNIEVLGRNSAAFDIGADIGGGFSSTGSISTNAFRFVTRAPFNPDSAADRIDLDAEDLGNAASSIQISGNVGRGVNLTSATSTTQDADGNDVEVITSVSAVNQFGSAPAILIDGEGTPIMIGTVSPITDPTDPDYDENQLYAFINEGTVTARGVYDEFDATGLSVSHATLDGGIFNAGTMQSQTFIGGEFRPIDGVDLGTGLARVIVLGDDAIAERLNNTGVIIATASEAVDEVYFDTDNIPAPRAVSATAIDIGTNASMGSLINDGTISAILIGRQGTAVVVRDASGTLSTITNRGAISAVGTNSDSSNVQDTDFTLIAFDLSANTSGVSILQELATDDDPDDGIEPRAPQIFGDILLGSGDDTLISTAGFIAGDIDFGAGDDTLSLNNTAFSGGLSNQDGLEITVANDSLLALTSAQPVSITSASFDGTSTFTPLVDGDAGTASTLQATGAISFAAGAQINPTLTNLINSDTVGNNAVSRFEIASGSSVTVTDLDALNASDDGSFLFDTAFDLSNDTLFVTVDLREATALGLDPTQIGLAESVFGATMQALQNNNSLGNQIANLGTASEFYAAYNQLLPEFAAAGRQFVIANSDGAVGAVGNHLDSARRSQDKTGGAWIQEFAYFADRDLAGLSEQYRGEGFGFSAGLDTALGPFHAVGVNVAFASTEVEDVIGVDDPLDMTSLMAGLYAGYETGNIGIDAYVGGGFNQFDQNRRIQVGTFGGESSGDWDGTHLNGSLRVGYDINLGKRFWARPVASLDYLRLSESGYEETGDLGVALIVDDRTSEMGAVTGLMNFGAEFNGARTWIRPSIRIGYRNEFLSDPVLTSYRFAGINNALLATTESADFPSSGLLVGFSVAAGSGFSSVGFDFDSDIREGFIRHTGRIVIRLLF
ncbi:autotransporter domain-containing protein [Algimonas porphyrae]|uniref:Autotransporter n=1 Tax=Algimonas porphyrae TaxID=1128113 RepID=A0ABQ5V398_9PROT|nr:autotransporter outer membrane beta-barrel domain-containing protein [Algimonas porphyrae]GLQ21928.1 autotransporter [Algimonas porphyrae]